MERIESPEVCASCGGSCCNSLPGAFSPADLRADDGSFVQRLSELLASGKYSIDWWEGDPTGGELSLAYFVRPATKNSRGIMDASWGGECNLHTPTGCPLPLAERPSGCATLAPSEGGKNCKKGYTKRKACVDWIPYTKKIEEAIALARSIK